jgi:hypothetical protein
MVGMCYSHCLAGEATNPTPRVVSVATQATDSADITTQNGKVYKNCKITRIEPDGITVVYASGIAKIAFADLSEEYRTKYGYTPEKAKAYSQIRAEGQRKQTFAALISVEDDKFRGTRTYSTKTEIKLGYRLSLTVYAVCPDSGRSGPKGVLFHFISSSSDWWYLKFHALVFLADGQRMSWDEEGVSHDGDVGSGYVLEQMNVILTPDQFRNLASAKTVEGRLGSTEFSITYADRESFRALSDYLEDLRGKTADKTSETIGAEVAPQPQH